MDNIHDQLIRDEGVRYKAYKDSLGYLTIGVGHNLSAKPISRRAVDVILEDDLNEAIQALESALPWVVNMDRIRYAVLVNMTFNMGIGGLLQFKNTLQDVQAGNYSEASRRMLQSTWAKQVG